MDPSTDNSNSPRRNWATWVFLAGAWTFAAGVILQVYFAGAGILVDPSYFGWHVTFAHLLEALFLVLIIAGLLGRVGPNALGWTGLLFLLYGLQYGFINGFDGPLRALHAVNALVMLLVALHLGRRQLRILQGLPPNFDGPAGDRLRRNLVVAILVAVPAIVIFAVLTPDPVATELADRAENESTSSAPTEAQVSDLALGPGATVYASRCSACHGDEGQGGFGPRLADGEIIGPQATVRQILNGGGGMPAFRGQLTSEQIAEVATFVGNSWGNEIGSVSPDFVEELR